MDDFTPYAIVVIKPFSIARGHAPDILQELLDKGGLILQKFRSWAICDTTWKAVCGAELDKEILTTPSLTNIKHAWVLLLTTKDGKGDPTVMLNALCGPLERTLWKHTDLRYRYSAYKTRGPMTHPADNVLYIADPARLSIIANLLFTTFDETLFLKEYPCQTP